MHKYYANKNSQSNGDHEVHTTGCSFMPAEHNRQYLGTFVSCRGAVQEAKKYFPRSNGCFYCSNECHTT